MVPTDAASSKPAPSPRSLVRAKTAGVAAKSAPLQRNKSDSAAIQQHAERGTADSTESPPAKLRAQRTFNRIPTDATTDVEFAASVEDTRRDLLAYLTFSPNENVNGAMRVADRNGRKDSAIAAPGTFKPVLDLASAAGTTDPTVVVWAFMNNMQKGEYLPATETGAWKLLSYVPSTGQVTVGVREIPSDDAAYGFYAGVLSALYEGS